MASAKHSSLEITDGSTKHLWASQTARFSDEGQFLILDQNPTYRNQGLNFVDQAHSWNPQFPAYLLAVSPPTTITPAGSTSLVIPLGTSPATS